MFIVVVILSYVGISVLVFICVIYLFLVLRNFFIYLLYIYEKFISILIFKKKLLIVIYFI